MDKKQYLGSKKRKQECIVYGPQYKSQYRDDEDSYLDGSRWIENASNGLRVTGTAHDISKANHRRSVDHKGWYANEYQDETVYGVVLQMPSRNGEIMYLAGVSDPNNGDCYLVWFDETFDDVMSAVRASDSYAEIYADHEREYQRVESAKYQIEELQGEIVNEYASFKALAKEIRSNCDKLTGMGHIKSLIRAEYRRVRSSVRKMRRQIRELQESI